VSTTIEMSERELKVWIFKFALSLAAFLGLIAFGLSLLANKGQDIAIPMILVSVCFLLFTNGILAVLKIIDWFEARKQKNG
jgi:protein-S-isoprenylcysteine O-methyltransferase Ste14